MKKKNLRKLAFLVLAGITFTGCSENQNQTVHVSKAFWEKAQKAAQSGTDFKDDIYNFLLKEMDSNQVEFDGIQKSLNDECNNADDILKKCEERLDEADEKIKATESYDLNKVQNALKKYQPDNVIETNSGKYGYVDLGLPSGTIWATANLGKQEMESINKKFNDYFNIQKPERPQSPTRPTITDIREYIKMKASDEISDMIEVPYNEFVQILEKTNYEAPSKSNISKMLMDIKDEMLDNYPSKVIYFRDHEVFDYERKSAPKYVEEFESAYNQYNFDILSHNYSYLLDPGKTYSWGSNFEMDVFNKKYFDSSEDWVTIMLGSRWATPTKEQVEELLNNCEISQINNAEFAKGGSITYESSNYYTAGKINGYELKSKKNGKYIFLINASASYMINERIDASTYYVFLNTIKTKSDRLPKLFVRPVYNKTN